ncbi:hypothetical protein [Nesterenkonia pannonica]|uniref:hypothetical protein n=1 Tax=Nesterenkonia pannonica TaxID=1548602 RepID=UPI002164A119|nr:hypothetical protein [Nesterenkonia pannonica]
MKGITYDTGALIAAEKGDRRFWAMHYWAAATKEYPTVPAGVLAEAWRGSKSAQIARVLKTCRIEDLTEEQAQKVGTLIGKSGLNDPVDVTVAEGAMRRGDSVVTSNRAHMEQIAHAAGKQLNILDV